jgi:pimeloyl-ACP methyl ester carboxylesterase
MPLPGLVLIHGGAHAADSWDLTIAELRSKITGLRVLAVDLPGRRAKPGDLRTATIRDWVDSVVGDIDQAGLDRAVVAGHSMAGLVMPGVVTRLGGERVVEAVFATAFVPPQGLAMADTMWGPAAPFARWGARLGRPYKLPIAARILFCNGMTRDQRQFAMSRLYTESMTIVGEPVDSSGMPAGVPRTWIMTLRDRTLSKAQQLASIEALGGVDAMYSIDTCHDAMISEPELLAQILLERCLARATAPC